jgi:GNAT superfamily N-acetyltransferase
VLGAIWRPLDMTTLTDTRTFTDRGLAASADRILHAAHAMDRPYAIHHDLVVVWQGERGMFTNLAVVLAEPDDWADVLARTAEVVPAGRPVCLVAAGSVPDLTSHGWQLIGHPPLMVRPPGGTGPWLPSELTITEVVDEAGLERFERTLVDGYPEPFLQPYRWGEVLDGRVLGGPTRFFTGWVHGHVVGTATGHAAAGVNVVEMIATMPNVRGRGYGAALTWAATVVEPSLPAVLFASDSGRPVYERLGYLPVSRWTLWYRPA